MKNYELESWECITDEVKKLLPVVEQKLYSEIPPEPEFGKFYRIYPEGCVSGNGKAYHGVLRLGTDSKKLIVFFNGGGYSYDAYTAARPNNLFTVKLKEAFYFNETELMGDGALEDGIAASREDNPFREWNIINILYATGDFHAGTGDFPYKALDGTERILPHHGYINTMAVIDMAKKWIGDVETLLICGSSAGGFGVSLMADEVIQQFPTSRNITCIVDSALLLKKEWPYVAENVWRCPKHIYDRLHSDNITLDSYVSLYEKYGNSIKYLFCCSIRDALLIQAQNSIDGKGMVIDREGCNCFQTNLRIMCKQLSERIPGIGHFIFDMPMTIPGYENFDTTKHCLLDASLFSYSIDGKTPCEWLLDAVNGHIESWGLGLFEKNPGTLD